ncbi:MAG: prolyl oligopeptidase family serine peptidase [Bdellovibrionales bacterium]|nr:prolyl oligopeptidase family serine peptidase [Bdellovibrionales bacterium]
MFKIIIFSMLISLPAHAKKCKSIQLIHDDYEYNDDIEIRSFDNSIIAANLVKPRTHNSEKLPTIIFVNSWALDEHEYLKQSLQFAGEGFQVLSYSARGWGCSDGMIDVIGDNDMKDISSVIDWLIQNTDADPDNIGMSGISYGGGMTLKALAVEPRLKTGAAMSAWGSLRDSLFGNNTPRAVWGAILLGSGYLLGNMDPHILELFKDMVRYENISELTSWTNKRSPLEFIELINKRSVPVYISNNFGDNLFQPNHIIEFYNRLTGPKQLDLNQGTHATGEAFGLFTVNNHTFKKVHAWFKYWLQNKLTEDFEMNSISVATNRNKTHTTFSSSTLKNPSYIPFYLEPKTILQPGRLSTTKNTNSNRTDWLASGRDTWATTGIPILSEILSGHFNVPVFKFEIPSINPFGVDYASEPLSKPLTLFGAPKITLQVKTNRDKTLFVAYLYDVNPEGGAKLVTHGVYTKLSSMQSKIEFELVATYHIFNKGHRLALSIDTQDRLYLAPIESPGMIALSADAKLASTLEIPKLK